MIIKVLAENNAVSDEFDTEHGLSLYIETGGKKILFDTGETDVFVKNARRLGVDLADVDMAVVSHGHCDHGGGLNTFYKENAKAPVYLHPKAMGIIIQSIRKGGNTSAWRRRISMKNASC